MAPPQTARTFLVRGLLVGVLAGLAAFVVASAFGEPAVARAISIEDATQQPDAGHQQGVGQRGAVQDGTVQHEAEPVSRGVQRTIGLGVALLAFGASFGGLFGLAFAVAHRRLGRLGARTTSAALGTVGFMTISLVPFAKYPASPPGVGSAATIDRRTGLYFLMVALSVLFLVAAVYVGRRLPWGPWDRVLGGSAVYLVLALVAGALLPTVDEVGPDFPASVLWSFRAGSLATLVCVWAVLGLAYGALTQRAEDAAAARLTVNTP